MVILHETKKLNELLTKGGIYMLILDRGIGETVMIGEDVYCTVLGFDGDKVRLAFDAPQSLPVHRQEIQQRIWREKRGEGGGLEDGLSLNETVVDRLITRFKNTKSCNKKLLENIA